MNLRANEKRLRSLEDTTKLLNAYDGGDGITIFEAQKLVKLIKDLDDGTSTPAEKAAADKTIAELEVMLEIKRIEAHAISEIMKMRKQLIKKTLHPRTPQLVAMDAPKCVVCGKRERHFGEYCKRCVPEDQRPKGKV